MISKIEIVKLNELPPLVHQLLKLSVDQNNTLLFSSLSKYFTHHYDTLQKSNQETDAIGNNTL